MCNTVENTVLYTEVPHGGGERRGWSNQNSFLRYSYDNFRKQVANMYVNNLFLN